MRLHHAFALVALAAATMASLLWFGRLPIILWLAGPLGLMGCGISLAAVLLAPRRWLSVLPGAVALVGNLAVLLSMVWWILSIIIEVHQIARSRGL